MNREEIENRIIVCEFRARGYREAGNTKSADRYDNERYKWEKLLSDLDLLNERKIMELLEYKKGYFNLQQELTDYKERNEKALDILKHINTYSMPMSEFAKLMEIRTILDKKKQID